MNAATSLVSFSILADSAIMHVGDKFRAPMGITPQHLAILATLVVLVIGAVLLFQRLQKRRDSKRKSDPKQLFLALCKLHKLGWNERKLLEKLARSQKIELPARFFLESELWHNATATSAQAELPGICALRGKLLGGQGAV